MEYIDTHCHLNLKRLGKNKEHIITEAQAVGVARLVVPGIDVATSVVGKELSLMYPHVISYAAGIHPHEAHKYHSLEALYKDITALEGLLLDGAVAVGECGLDYCTYSEKIPSEQAKDIQKKLFKSQVTLAKNHKKPLIIHCREAIHDLLPILLLEGDEELFSRTVFHCGEPEPSILTFMSTYKAYVGVDGDYSYDEKKRSFLPQVPLDRIVLETDAPFLLPEPYRSRKEFPNVPAHIPHIAETVASLLQCSLQEVARITTANAMRLFSLKTL